MLFIIEQYMVPLVQHAMTPLRSNDMIGIIERILKLTVSMVYIFLLNLDSKYCSLAILILFMFPFIVEHYWYSQTMLFNNNIR